jgi:hypothetical protein
VAQARYGIAVAVVFLLLLALGGSPLAGRGTVTAARPCAGSRQLVSDAVIQNDRDAARVIRQNTPCLRPDEVMYWRNMLRLRRP